MLRNTCTFSFIWRAAHDGDLIAKWPDIPSCNLDSGNYSDPVQMQAPDMGDYERIHNQHCR